MKRKSFGKTGIYFFEIRFLSTLNTVIAFVIKLLHSLLPLTFLFTGFSEKNSTQKED